MSQVDGRPEETPPPAHVAGAADATDATGVPLPLPRRRRRRRVAGVMTRPPLRGPRPERHRPARDAVEAAGRLPGPDALSEVQLRCAYDHLDADLRPVPGPDDATDAIVFAFCSWLAAQDEAGRAVVAAVRAEREDVATAARVLTRMRTKEALIGSIQAERIDDLAALAPLYRRARRGPVPSEQDGEGVGEGVGAAFAAQAQAVAAAGLDDLVAELAPALGWTEYTAASQVLLAQTVVAVMPHALERLAAGQLSMAGLTATVNRLSEVDDVVAGTIDEHLFGADAVGMGLTLASLREEVDHQVQLHDPEAATRRVRAKTSARRVCYTALGDGQAKLSLIGPVTAVAAVALKVRAAARANLAAARDAAREGVPAPGGGDPYADDADQPDERSVAAHAFDAAVTALGAVRPEALDASSAGWAVGTGMEIRISLPALVGVDDDPGYVEGYGWVPAWLVRTALGWGRCRLRRVLTDPFTGDLIAVDGHTYPASWLTDPGPDTPDPGPDPGGPQAPGGDGGPPPPPRPPQQPPSGGRRAGFFRGRPIQQLPPPPAELISDTDSDLAAGDVGDVGGAVEPADPCQAGTCEPVDPTTCPLGAIGGGPHDPPEALRRHVSALWGTSTGPGDLLPAHQADLDHVT
ncbi:hypothetical protein ACUN7V_20765, partial [Quadrisphaera oryzae]